MDADYPNTGVNLACRFTDQLRDRAARKAILLPVFLYDHSGLAMNTIGFHCPWDSGQVGYVYVTLEAARKEFGVKRVTKVLREKAADILRGEIVSYDAYLGGRVYGYVIEQDGEEVDSCWGFVGDYELDCLLEARHAVPDHEPKQSKNSDMAQAHPYANRSATAGRIYGATLASLMFCQCCNAEIT